MYRCTSSKKAITLIQRCFILVQLSRYGKEIELHSDIKKPTSWTNNKWRNLEFCHPGQRGGRVPSTRLCVWAGKHWRSSSPHMLLISCRFIQWLPLLWHLSVSAPVLVPCSSTLSYATEYNDYFNTRWSTADDMYCLGQSRNRMSSQLIGLSGKFLLATEFEHPGLNPMSLLHTWVALMQATIFGTYA